MSDIVADTADYETWLRSSIPVVEADLTAKHAELAASELRFLRGTYYFWLRRMAALLPTLADAPDIPLVGDLHIENFGSWRDKHGVQRWGVNDLDELGRGPYVVDLVRLATSCILNPHLGLATKQVCDLLLSSWLSAEPGHSANLDDAHHLQHLLPAPRPAEHFYADLAASAGVQPPRVVVDAVAESVQGVQSVQSVQSVEGAWEPTWHSRRAGTGSLGHPRYVAVQAHTAREAKLLGPPSAQWAGTPGFSPDPALYATVQHAIRGPWPASRVAGWQLRRLAPDVLRIDITVLAAHDVERVLASMAQAVVDVHGVDTAALATARADAQSRGSSWLHDAVTTMAQDTHEAWQAWKSSRAATG